MIVVCQKCGRQFDSDECERECPHISNELVRNYERSGAREARDKEADAKKGCFIATACYGDYEHPAVREFRWFRDTRMRQTTWGRLLVRSYYQCSPPIARFLQDKPAVAALVRRYLLAPILRVLRSAHERNEA